MNSYNKLIHLLVLIVDSYLFRSPVGVTELILVHIEVPVVTTEVPVVTTELILIKRYP